MGDASAEIRRRWFVRDPPVQVSSSTSRLGDRLPRQSIQGGSSALPYLTGVFGLLLAIVVSLGVKWLPQINVSYKH